MAIPSKGRNFPWHKVNLPTLPPSPKIGLDVWMDKVLDLSDKAREEFDADAVYGPACGNAPVPDDGGEPERSESRSRLAEAEEGEQAAVPEPGEAARLPRWSGTG